MSYLPSFPMIRKWVLAIAFILSCFLLGLLKRILS